jgi:hypothetical protein
LCHVITARCVPPTRVMAAPIGKLGKAGRAVVLRGQGGPEKLTVVKDWYCAHPAPGEVMVHTVSTSVNPVDIYQRSGTYKLQFFPKVCGCAEMADDACPRVANELRRGAARAGAGQRRGGRGGASAGGVAGA